MLPRLLLIADRFTDPHRARVVRRAVTAGVPWVQLRDHRVDPDTFARVAEALVPVLQAENPNLLLSVNTHLEVAQRLGLGLHVGRRGPSVAEARRRLGPGRCWATRRTIWTRPVGLLMKGPIICSSAGFPTASKSGVPAVGLEALAAVCRAVPIPVLALGGITPERVSACLQQVPTAWPSSRPFWTLRILKGPFGSF